MNLFLEKLKNATLLALPKANKTTLWILKIIIPVSLIVSILQYLGAIAFIAPYLTPIFTHIGLPGESSIVFITSIFLPLYAPIAISTSLALGVREITILAIMCLISHNMIVETAIQKKAGSNYFVMFAVRILSSFVAAYALNKLLPNSMNGVVERTEVIHFHNFGQLLIAWAINSFWLMLKIWLIITGLIILQQVLKEFNLLDKIALFFAPLMGILGLSKNSAFLWFIAHVLGLTYGSAVLINSVHSNEINPAEANLLNFHIAVNHSTLEDTLLFVVIGVSALWLIIPRFVLSIVIVWTVRLVHFLQGKNTSTLSH